MNGKILIVDDEANFREIMSVKLQSAGFEISVAKDGKEAIKKAEEIIPDLILMDIHMPNETGTDVALFLKQGEKTKNSKIVFLTSLKEPWPAMAGEKEKIAKELGMEDFIQKSDDLDAIVARVQSLLMGSAPPASQSQPADAPDSQTPKPTAVPEEPTQQEQVGAQPQEPEEQVPETTAPQN